MTLLMGLSTEAADCALHGPWAADKYGCVWKTGHGQYHDYGLFRRPGSVGLWAHVRLRWWFGLEVRWDPKIMGRKVMVTLFGHDIGWLE